MQGKQRNIRDCSVIILAAGKSSRMGSQKFALKFDDTHIFLEQIIKQYKSFGCQEIIVILNNEGVVFVKENLPQLSNDIVIVKNNHLEWERFYSIKLGIKNLTNTHPVFIHNVDNPFVSQEVLKQLFINHTPNEFIVPVFEGRGGHPILLSNEISQAIITENKHELILSDFLKRYTKKRIAVDDKRILVNINTEEKYRKIIKQN